MAGGRDEGGAPGPRAARAREVRASDVLERMRRTATREAATRDAGIGSPGRAGRAGGSGVAADVLDASPAADVRRMAPSAASRPRVRYTLDLSGAQHHHLKLFALHAGVEASRVVRALLVLLEDDETLAERVVEQLSGGAVQ